MRRLGMVVFIVFLCAHTASAGSFRDNGNGTITDLVTNLTWQQCSAGLSGAGCATGSAGLYVWDGTSGAIAYCQNLLLNNFTDWRLPTVTELSSLVDDSRSSAPVINISYFPNTQSNGYWSSTTSASAVSNAWSVRFDSGSPTANGAKTSQYYVRCVRGQ